MNIRIVGLIALALFCTVNDTARADDTFRCGNRLVEPGMTRAEVRELCGDPAEASDEVQDVHSGDRVTGTTMVHRWTYTSYSKTRVLVFDQDVLKSISSE